MKLNPLWGHFLALADEYHLSVLCRVFCMTMDIRLYGRTCTLLVALNGHLPVPPHVELSGVSGVVTGVATGVLSGVTDVAAGVLSGITDVAEGVVVGEGGSSTL